MATEKLDLLILKTLDLGPLHGYGIGQRIEQVSGGVFKVTLGSLYPALQRLESAGHIDAEWRATENNRRARYYRITRRGTKAPPRGGEGLGAGLRGRDPGLEGDVIGGRRAAGRGGRR